MTGLGGIDLIEERPNNEVDQLPISGTVFGEISVRLQILGIVTDQTVGGVMEALGYPRGSESAKYYAHEIGCTCHGKFIGPDLASQRVLNLIGCEPF